MYFELFIAIIALRKYLQSITVFDCVVQLRVLVSAVTRWTSPPPAVLQYFPVLLRNYWKPATNTPNLQGERSYIIIFVYQAYRAEIQENIWCKSENIRKIWVYHLH